MMIEGALSWTSFMKRTTVLSRLPCPYSAKYVPASNPIGAPIKIPSAVMMTLPTMAIEQASGAAWTGVSFA